MLLNTQDTYTNLYSSRFCLLLWSSNFNFVFSYILLLFNGKFARAFWSAIHFCFKDCKKHGSTVDVSVIINAFDSFTNKVNHVNSLLQRRVDSWEKCLTVGETDDAADKEYFKNYY